MSICRQNYAQACEQAVNGHVAAELRLAYAYTAMSLYFDRDDVALAGVQKLACKLDKRHREDAERLLRLQADRGGRVVLEPILKPAKSEWAGGPLEALEDALSWEKTHNELLIKLHHVADENHDPHLEDFIEDHYLNQQVTLIKKLADLCTNAKLAGKGLGEFLFDKECLQEDDHV